MGARNPQGDFELRRETFENGVALIGNEVRETETVAISGSIKSGTICDQLGKFGAAELVSRLLMRGSKTHTASEISQAIEETGATLSFDNFDESISFTARCHFGVLENLLQTIAECLTEPVFPDKEIELARDEILTDIKSEEDDTRSVAFRELMALLYGAESPYGRNPLGKAEDLKRLTRSDLKKFHEENYSPSRTVFAITGRFDFDRVRSKLDSLLSPEGSTIKSKAFNFDEPDPIPSGISISEMQHKTQVDLALGTRMVPRKSELFYSLNLGNLVLGRLGLYGRLGKNVRDEKGLAYYCYSAVQAKLFSGNLGIFAGVNPKNIDKAVEGITEEVVRITSEEIPANELETAKKNSIGSLAISLDTSSERVNILHDIEYYGLGLDYLEKYREILASVTSDDILSNLRQYLDLDMISLVAAGPVGNTELRAPKDIMKKAA